MSDLEHVTDAAIVAAAARHYVREHGADAVGVAPSACAVRRDQHGVRVRLADADDFAIAIYAVTTKAGALAFSLPRRSAA